MSPSTRNTLAWILQALLAFAFTASGIMKFLDLSKAVSMFSSLGMPSWFAYFIATAEVLGGIGLLVPRFLRPSALGLTFVMLGAVFMHATRIPGGLPKGIPAIVLLVLLIILLFLRRPTSQAV